MKITDAMIDTVIAADVEYAKNAILCALAAWFALSVPAVLIVGAFIRAGRGPDLTGREDHDD